MALLSKQDLYTHLYQEIIEEIVRSTAADNTIIERAITAGEAEARAYLRRYNLAEMFVPNYTDELLRNKVKDIVCWHLVRLANPNVNLELFRTLYEDATKFFEKVQKGIIDPEWPLKADSDTTPQDDAGNVFWKSQRKRQNHF